MAPIRKPMRIIMKIRRFFEIWTPMPSPKGVMAISAPSWKKPMPITSMTAPQKNITIVPNSMGIKSMLIPKTIPVIGKTAESDSRIFSFSFGFICHFSGFSNSSNFIPNKSVYHIVSAVCGGNCRILCGAQGKLENKEYRHYGNQGNDHLFQIEGNLKQKFLNHISCSFHIRYFGSCISCFGRIEKASQNQYHIVKAEPAIQVLNRQVEGVTNGEVSAKTMNRCLSVGVAVSVSKA